MYIIILNIHIIEVIIQSVLSFIQTFTNIKIIHLIIVNLNRMLQPQENYFFSFSDLVGTFVQLWRKLHVELPPVLHVEGVILCEYISSSLQEAARIFPWRSTCFEVNLYPFHFPTFVGSGYNIEGLSITF